MSKDKFDLREWIREAASAAQDEAVENMEAAIEDLNPDWTGGDNLEHPIDHAKAYTGIESVKSPEVLDDLSEAPADVDGDGIISKDELYSHFDVDDDGHVNMSDYADHIRHHIDHPELVSKFERKAGRSAMTVPCPGSYDMAAKALVGSPHEAASLLKPLMDATGASCPSSVAKALADMIEIAQALGVVGDLK